VTNPRRPRPFRAIGVDRILRLAGDRRIVVIAPHPDDETLGCGSLIASAVGRRIPVGVVALTDGDGSHPGSQAWPPAALGRLRAGEMRRALARLGAGGVAVRRLGWGDGRVVADARVGHLRRQLVALRAGVVLVTSDADHHLDHRAAARLAAAAARSLGLPLIHYAVWSRVLSESRGRDCLGGAKRWAALAHRSQLGTYITDDPAGFWLEPATLASLVGGRERFEQQVGFRTRLDGGHQLRE